MGTKTKKQHFVPKFHLRNFSILNNRTHTNLFIKDKQKVIENVFIDGQLYEKYFYDNDGTVEDFLGKIENKASSLIKDIVEKIQLPGRFSGEYLTLLLHTFLQDARTRSNAKNNEDAINQMMWKIFSHDEKLKEYAGKVYFKHPYPGTPSLVPILMQFDALTDLDWKILHNTTKRKFITSDHPITKYNSFLEKRNFPISHGIASKGLQVFFALSPNICLHYYDPKVYKVGSKNTNVVKITDIKDIDSINLLQMLYSDELIYFDSAEEANYVETIYRKSIEKPFKKPTTVNEYPFSKLAGGNKSTLLHYVPPSTRIKLILPFIKETPHATYYKMTGYSVELRDESFRHIDTQDKYNRLLNFLSL